MVTVREEFYIRLRRVARLGGFALARSVGDTDFASRWFLCYKMLGTFIPAQC